MFSMQCKKNITVENNIRKRMNIAKFTNIYTYLYTYNIRDKNGLHKLQEATSNTAIIEKKMNNNFVILIKSISR